MVSSGSNRQIGVCSWSIQPRTPADLLRSMEWIGIHACQLALVPLVEDSKHWRHGIEAIQSADVEILSGMLAMVGEDYSTLESIRSTGGVANDATWEENFVRADVVAGFAADHGIDLVSFHAGFIPHEKADPRRPIIIDRLKRVAACFRRRNIRIALETGQENAETLIEVLAELRDEQVGVNFDPANMILYGMGDPVAALRMLADHVRQIHIKDALPSPQPGEWGTEMPVGKGAVDWAAFLEGVADLPLEVDLVIERESGTTREEDVATAFRMLETNRAIIGV